MQQLKLQLLCALIRINFERVCDHLLLLTEVYLYCMLRLPACS